MKKIAFIGAGKHTQNVHLPVYLKSPHFEVVAICDRDGELAAAVAKRAGVPRSYDSHSALLAAEPLDAVIVVLSGTPVLERILSDLVDARIPTLVEKPMAWTGAAADRVVARAESVGTLLRVGYHKRSDPASMAAHRLITEWKEKGTAGKMTYARVFVSHAGDWIQGAYDGALVGNAKFPPSTAPKDNPLSLSEKGLDRLGSFAGAHSHQLDLMRFLVGEDFHVTGAHPSEVLLNVETKGGVPAVFEFTPYASTKDWVEYGIVCFERGYVRVDLPAPLAVGRAGTLEFLLDDGSVAAATRPVFPAKSAMAQQAENWNDALEGRSGVLCTPREGAHAVALCEEWAKRLYGRK